MSPNPTEIFERELEVLPDDAMADEDYWNSLTASDPQPAIELIDWATIDELEDAIVDGVVHPGRWTAIVAGAKQGKSELILNVAIHISNGRDPFDGSHIEPASVLYLDAEMGRFDLRERIVGSGHDPQSLTNFYASDLPPKLDTPEGGAALLDTVRRLNVSVVVIDGINGTITGAEKDDSPWRDFYRYSIAPLKQMGIAIVTADNLGKDKSLGPRGSSVKLDKADAVVQLERTDNGIKLKTTHRRTSTYPAEWSLSIGGLDGSEPVTYRRVDTIWPEGTEALVELLDSMGVPTNIGRGKVRTLLKEGGHKATNSVLAAAVRYRKIHSRQLDATLEGLPDST